VHHDLDCTPKRDNSEARLWSRPPKSFCVRRGNSQTPFGPSRHPKWRGLNVDGAAVGGRELERRRELQLLDSTRVDQLFDATHEPSLTRSDDHDIAAWRAWTLLGEANRHRWEKALRSRGVMDFERKTPSTSARRKVVGCVENDRPCPAAAIEHVNLGRGRLVLQLARLEGEPELVAEAGQRGTFRIAPVREWLRSKHPHERWRRATQRRSDAQHHCNKMPTAHVA